MDKLLQVLDKIIPLLPFYPPWARTLFAVSFLATMLSIGIFVVMYPAAARRKDDSVNRSAIGLNVSLLETQNSSDDPLELGGDLMAVNYRFSQEHENIVVTPRVGYLDLVAHGGPIYAAQFDYTPFDLNLPGLDIKVVNNGKETLFLSGALLEVDQSEVDREPVIIIRADIYGDFAGQILLENDGWSDVEKPVLRFNVAPSNPDDWTIEGSFAKPPAGTLEQSFTNEIRCESFSESAKVDISKALSDAGANIERLSELETIEIGTESGTERVVTEGRDDQHETFTREEYDRELKKALSPFVDNLALVEGEIDYETHAAPAGKRKVRFCTFVHLYNEHRAGAPPPTTCEYNVLLRTEGSHYTVPVNVSQEIKPGELDRFTLRVGAQKSSQHRFRIRFIYNGQKELLSGPIDLKVFIPRSVVKLISAKAK
jgi:hypothetical protein